MPAFSPTAPRPSLARPPTRRLLRRLLKKLRRRRYDSDAQASPLAKRVRQGRLTYLSYGKLANLEWCIEQLDQDDVPGDFVEAGVALGGSAILLSSLLGPERRFLGYDVFETIPPPGPEDEADSHARYRVIAAGESKGMGGDTYYGYVDDLYAQVCGSFDDFGLTVDQERIVLEKGLFEETLRPDAPIALAHVDCDWYEPVRLCLQRIEPWLAPGGFVVLDDYHDYRGCAKAVDEWLGETPDNEKVVTEAFDLEEMPESGIATGALATEVEDLIGDLMENSEELDEASDDGATTHALPDMEMGWEVKERDIASYAAKGKSGNERPDHKEQDGRSNVGRQGMSTGETAAGSGTISEGDDNIEERRTEDPTQSGQVDLDGEADTKATGGGKLASGKADSEGMSGGVERMDSNEEGSDEGMAALMAREADAIYAKASMKNVRVDELKDAAHHLRQSADAIAKGDIQQVKEHRRIAVTSLQRAKAHLEAGTSSAMDTGGASGSIDDVIESGPDQAPPQFRDRVSEYYKALNDEL